MGKTFRALVCVLLAAPSAAFAQRFDDIGVRAQGMGGAFVAVADDASATWWNPAGLAHALTVVDLSASVLKDGGRAIALGFPSLGLSYYHLNVVGTPSSATTDHTRSDRQLNEASGSGLSPDRTGLSQFGVTVGQSLTPHFVVATTLKLVSALGDTRADLDIGGMASAGPLRAGITIRDVRQPTFGTGDGALELSRRSRAGLAWIEDWRGVIDRIAVSVDSDLTASTVAGHDERELAGGAEVWLLGRRIGIRGGGGINTAADDESFGSFGVTVVPYPRLNLDGALTRGSDSTRDRWSLGLRLTF